MRPAAQCCECRGGDAPILRDGGAISSPDTVYSFDALWDSMEKCRRGVVWKDSVAHFVLNGAQEVERLSSELCDGTYRSREPRTFAIHYPKERMIVSIPFRDRVYQRSLNDNVVYPLMTNSFIYDNCACQKGKGTDFARSRLKTHMQRHFRKHGTEGWVLQIDIKGYYRNLLHSHVESVFRERLPEWAFRDVLEILHRQYPGDIGYDAGSQLVQIAGISALDQLDHFIKERLRVKGYVRYMDDMVLIAESKERLEECRSEIRDRLSDIGLSFNEDKTRIFRLQCGIGFLGFNFRLTETGKVVMKAKRSNVRHAKRRFRRMSRNLPRDKLEECYGSYRAHLKKGCRGDVYMMDRWFKEMIQDAYQEKQDDAKGAA